jgi:hypothetical protein
MMGIVLLGVVFLLGYCLVKQFTAIKKPAFVFSGAFLIGCLFTGVFLYLLDLFFDTKSHFISDIIYFIVAGVYIIYALIRLGMLWKLAGDLVDLLKDRWLLGFLILALVFSIWLDYHTFSVNHGTIKVVGSWSDIMFHHAFVRTISQGSNIPPQYPYYANSPVHYHFLFDYFVAKVAQLGLYSVHALNIMSLLSLTVLLLLIFEFGRSYFKSTAVGILGAVFLMFHSSLSGFTWLSQNFNQNVFARLAAQEGWLEGANFESWGLFNLNVFTAQRQFAFSLGCLIFIVYLIFSFRKECNGVENRFNWMLIRRNIFLGLIIGALPFWHAIVASISLGLIALFGLVGIKNRNFFYGMICAGVAGAVLVFPQLALFKTNDPVLSQYPVFYLGYGLDQFSFPVILQYYFQVLGWKLILIGAAFFLVNWQKKFDFLILLFPFVLANVFQLGPILYDNNKLLIISLVFLNCFAAYVIVWLFQKLPKALSILPALLVLGLILAGVVDFFAVKNMRFCEIADQKSTFKQWIVKNTKPTSVFLTGLFIPFDDNNMTQVVLAGRRLYGVRNNTQHIGNTDQRFEKVIKFYTFTGKIKELKQLLRREGINYVLIDGAVKNNDDFKLNEGLFPKNFELKYQDDNVSVYAVQET